METRICILFMFLMVAGSCYCNGTEDEVPEGTVRVNRLSEQVAAVLEHYKSADPIGMPGAPIPDPMPVPEMKKDIPFSGTLTLKNQSVYGLSKFRIESAYSNLADMEMSVALKIENLQVLGNYTLKGWFSSSGGASNTTLLGLYAEGLAKLEVAREGHLEATDIDMNLEVTDIDIHLENPGTMGSVLQGVMNSLGAFVFDTMKPFIMSQVNNNILRDVNTNLRKFKKTFPNSLSPLDTAFSEGRKLVRKMGYDPYKMDDFQKTTGILGLDITHIWITGMSSFYRVGNITLSMENNTVRMEVHAGTQQLEGKCHWEVSMVGLVNVLGTLTFTIEYLEVDAKVNQSLDVRNRPNVEDLDVVLGNFQLQFDGAGTIDYVAEVVVNILPNLFRHQIMLAVKEPLKIKVQEIFNDIDVEKMIMDNVEQLDNMEGNGKAVDEFSSQQPPPEEEEEEGLTIDESQLDDNIF